MELIITDEENEHLDALLILRTALITEKQRLTGMCLPTGKIDTRLSEVNLIIRPLNVKRGRQRSQDDHEAKITGSTYSQLMKMCSLVTGLVVRGVKLTPRELERFRSIAVSVGHTKAISWFNLEGQDNDRQ